MVKMASINWYFSLNYLVWAGSIETIDLMIKNYPQNVGYSTASDNYYS